MTKEHRFNEAAAWAALAACGAVVAGAAQSAEPERGIIEALEDGKPIFDLRPRYAGVDQAGFSEDAAALTLRTALGWQTGAWRGLAALIEFEDVRALVEDYNSTVNGETAFPVEADPEGTELNRAQLSWTNGDGLTATAGRQRITFDDHRFVGNVGWRQDEQTFDAARVDYVNGSFTASYAYVWGVERVFAEEADWGASGHLVNASLKLAETLKVSGFAYVLDLDEAAALSTATIGAAVSGSFSLDPATLSYAGVIATQSDTGDNPGDVDLGYARVDLGAAHGPLSVTASYEALEGDGTRGFSTPLATLHAFQGWADVFLTTPADGIEDAFVTARLAPQWSAGPVSNPALTVVFHAFEAERTGADLGSELDVQLSARLGPKLTGLVKLADYDGPDVAPIPGLADRTKVWVGVQFNL
jgi:hypothetical protein